MTPISIFDPRDYGYIGNGDVANAEKDTSAFEHIFTAIRSGSGSGTIRHPYGRGMMCRRLRPACRFALIGEQGYMEQTSAINPIYENSSLHFFAGTGGFVLDSVWTSGNGLSAQGSLFDNVSIIGGSGYQGNGNIVYNPNSRLRPWAPGASRIIGDIVTRPPLISTDYVYEVVQPGVASIESDPTATWPTVDGAQVTDGTMILVARFAAGIWCRTQTTFRRVRLQSHWGHGLVIRATTQNAAETPDDVGIADDCHWYEGRSDFNVGHGVKIIGGDGSTCILDDISLTMNHGRGVWDSGFLGNTFIDVHTESNRLEPFRIDNANARSYMLNCYSEGDQIPNYIKWPSISRGGTHANGWSTDSDGDFDDTGHHNRLQVRTRMAGGRTCEIGFGGSVPRAGTNGVLNLAAYGADQQLETSVVRLQYDTAEKGWWDLGDESKGGIFSISTSRSSVGGGNLKFGKGLYYGTPGDPYIPSMLRYVATGEWFRADVFNLVNNGYRNIGDRADGVDVCGSPGVIKRIDYAFMQSTRSGVTIRNTWSANTTYNANERHAPTIDNGHAYSASGGTTGSTEPIWPLTSGGTVLDGTCTWTEIGPSVFWREYGSVGGYITKNVSGNTNVILDALSIEFNTESIEFTGILTSNISIVLPALPGYKRWIYNHTQGLYTLTIKTAKGTGPVIGQNMAAWVTSGNGTNILRQTPDTSPT